MAKVTREEYEERILLAQMYIWRHLDEPLCLDEIAKAVSFSPFHFHRLFAAMTGAKSARLLCQRRGVRFSLPTIRRLNSASWRS